MKCKYCETTKNLIHHHVKYKELHGVDKIIILCRSCHGKLHKKLRRNGNCNILPKKLRRIFNNAQQRLPELRKYKDEYIKEFLETIEFHTTMYNNCQLRERIIYNNKTGNVSFNSGFKDKNGIIYKEINK